MKTKIKFAAVLLALFIVSTANAQIKFGVKAGLNVTDMSFNSKVFDSSNRMGFFAGPTLKIGLPIGGLGVDVSALYDQRSAKVNDETIKQQNIVVPVNARWTFGLGGLAAIYVAAGPQFGFNVGDDEFKWTDKDSYANTFKMKDSNFSMNLGAGVNISKFEVGVNYNIVCGKTGDATVTQALQSVTKKNRANAWQISAAYYF